MENENLAGSPEGSAVPETMSVTDSMGDTATVTTQEEDGSEELLAALEDQEGSGEEDGPSDLVDIEYEGKSFKVPSHLKDAFMRDQDYTKKTTEVAEQRKAVEAKQEAIKAEAQALAQNTKQAAQVYALETQFQQKFGGVTDQQWLQLQAEDPVEFQKLRFEHDSIINQHTQAKAQLERSIGELKQQQSEAVAKQRETAQAEMSKRVKGWSPETDKAVRDHAVASWGISETDVAHVHNPAHLTVMHKAMLYDKLLSKAQSKKPVSAEPVPQVKGSKQAAPKGVSDKMSTDEWMKRRMAQAQG
jgi:F0F1-type ATP synthase membrane subunit b/b'